MAVSIPVRAVTERLAVRREAIARGQRALPTVAASAAIVVGGIVLLGWWLGFDALKSIVPGAMTMKVNAAIGFVLMGSGMLLQARGHRAAGVPIAIVVVLSVIVGFEYVLGRDLGLDQLLFPDPLGRAGAFPPGRISPMTAICFIVLGAGLLLAGLRRVERVASTLFLGALLIGFFNVLDASFEPTAPTLLSNFTPMALITAATFMVVSVGALNLLPSGGPFAVFWVPGASARLARRLLAASVLVPAILMWLWLTGERAGFYATEYGASLVVLAMVVFLAAVVHQAARSALRSDTARQAIVEERDRFFDVSVDLLATADVNGFFIRLNPAWTATLGYSLDELQARPFLDFVHPDDRAATLAEYSQQVAEGKNVLNFQNRYRHRDGSYRWLEWASAPSADATRLYAAARDITGRKTEEEGLAAMLAPARQAQRRRAEAHRRIEGVIALRAFAPVFQPIVELATRRIIGFEALTRFHDGSRPDETFALAVDCGLGIALETVTLESALRNARHLPAGAWLSLNVSPALVADDAALGHALAPRSRPVVLEITEHEAVSEYAPLRDAVLGLGSDVRLAVDDAGAGVANFNHLVELRPDFLKIDVGLVRGVDSDVGRQAVVAGLLHFAASSGCQVIAEGIETEAELEMVRRLGVTLGQGYLLARPAAAEAWNQPAIEDVHPVAPTRARRRIDVASAAGPVGGPHRAS